MCFRERNTVMPMNWLRRLFKRVVEPPDEAEASQCCLVGNIVAERPFGEGGVETREGTKHFSPGTKVYAYPAQWGDGYEKILVIGKHRGSTKFVSMVIRSTWVTNWRAKVVYHPEVLRRLRERSPLNWKGKREVRHYLKGLEENERRRAEAGDGNPEPC